MRTKQKRRLEVRIKAFGTSAASMESQALLRYVENTMAIVSLLWIWEESHILDRGPFLV